MQGASKYIFPSQHILSLFPNRCDQYCLPVLCGRGGMSVPVITLCPRGGKAPALPSLQELTRGSALLEETNLETLELTRHQRELNKARLKPKCWKLGVPYPVRGRKQPGPAKQQYCSSPQPGSCVGHRKTERDIHYCLGCLHPSLPGIQYWSLNQNLYE